MQKRILSPKRTKKEIALSIIREGELDHYRSSAQFKYYRAFGQMWLITYTSPSELAIKSIEQVNENYQNIRF